MKIDQIKVEYKGKLNRQLDDKIRQAFKSIGYRFIGSGYYFEKDLRDLVFEKKRRDTR